ncbi:hypothetical protein FRC11_014088, partial [Ceratobasidium sp. 423]
MSSPPGTPKQKEGIRHLLEPLSRSRLQSPPQHIPTALSVVTDEHTGSVINSIMGVPLVENEAASTNLAERSSIHPTEGTGSASGTPTILESIEDGHEMLSH